MGWRGGRPPIRTGSCRPSPPAVTDEQDVDGTEAAVIDPTVALRRIATETASATWAGDLKGGRRRASLVEALATARLGSAPLRGAPINLLGIRRGPQGWTKSLVLLVLTLMVSTGCRAVRQDQVCTRSINQCGSSWGPGHVSGDQRILHHHHDCCGRRRASAAARQPGRPPMVQDPDTEDARRAGSIERALTEADLAAPPWCSSTWPAALAMWPDQPLAARANTALPEPGTRFPGLLTWHDAERCRTSGSTHRYPTSNNRRTPGRGAICPTSTAGKTHLDRGTQLAPVRPNQPGHCGQPRRAAPP